MTYVYWVGYSSTAGPGGAEIPLPGPPEGIADVDEIARLLAESAPRVHRYRRNRARDFVPLHWTPLRTEARAEPECRCADDPGGCPWHLPATSTSITRYPEENHPVKTNLSAPASLLAGLLGTAAILYVLRPVSTGMAVAVLTIGVVLTVLTVASSGGGSKQDEPLPPGEPTPTGATTDLPPGTRIGLDD